MTPLYRVFRMMYWSIRKDWRVVPHLTVVLAGWLANLARLRLIGRPGQRTVAIGMVEHLGDIVAAEPVARFARLRHPDAKIVWIVRKPYAAVPAGFATVDAVIGITCLTEWLLLRASGIGDPAWDLHINQRYCPRCQVPVEKIGPAAAIDPETYHRMGNLLAVECLSAGIPVLIDGPVLPVDASAAAAVHRLALPERFVVVHCLSNDPAKDWPRSNWSLLVTSIQTDIGLAVVEIGLLPLLSDCGQRDFCGQLSINETAEVIRRSVLFIGIDSGPAHLANAVGTPGVIMIGHYKGYDGFMPYSGGYQNGERAEIIRADGRMTDLPVAPVMEAVRRRLGLP